MNAMVEQARRDMAAASAEWPETFLWRWRPKARRSGPSPYANKGVSAADVLALREAGKTRQEIAVALGITKSAVKYHIRKARKS